jgi:hypothetical protein
MTTVRKYDNDDAGITSIDGDNGTAHDGYND